MSSSLYLFIIRSPGRCQRQFSQYTCPRCNSRYCFLQCYRVSEFASPYFCNYVFCIFCVEGMRFDFGWCSLKITSCSFESKSYMYFNLQEQVVFSICLLWFMNFCSCLRKKKKKKEGVGEILILLLSLTNNKCVLVHSSFYAKLVSFEDSS